MTSQDRVLYVSPLVMSANNGMMQRQHQVLAALCQEFPGRVDFLALAATPASARAWLSQVGLNAKVLDGLFVTMARLNAMAWYYGNVVACNGLKLVDQFRCPFITPLPRAVLSSYSRVVCYYAWAYLLLALIRAGDRVLVDLGDVMADRHERIGIRRWISLASADERSIVLGPARCVAISEGDMDEFRRIYGTTLSVVPFVPPNAASLLATGPAQGLRTIGFIGAPSYHNEQILKLLAHKEFLTELQRQGIELQIAGGICATADRAVLEALRAGGARVLGRVDDVGTFYSGLGAVLNPVGPSTGVKIKSVEALMAGRGLITTRWGTDLLLDKAFPLQVTSLGDWPVTPADLAKACVECLARPLTLGAGAGRAYLEASAATLRSHLVS